MNSKVRQRMIQLDRYNSIQEVDDAAFAIRAERAKRRWSTRHVSFAGRAHVRNAVVRIEVAVDSATRGLEYWEIY